MKFRDYLFAGAFAFSFTILLQYFLGSSSATPDASIKQEVVSGQSFVAPVQESLSKPLQRYVQLEHFSGQEQLTTLTTSLGIYTFSNQGAVLKDVVYNGLGSGNLPLTTLQNSQAFLVGFDKKTPMQFELVTQEETDALFRLVYKAQLSDGELYKTFDVYKDYYQLDVNVEIKNALHETYDCRLFLAAPHVALQLPENYETTLEKSEVQKINHAVNTLQIINAEEYLYHNDRQPSKLKQLEFTEKNNLYEKYWATPNCFVMTDKYFIHGLIGSGEKPLRAYVSAEKIYKEMIFEIPSLSNTSWKASFYMGPKEIQAVQQVDDRLEQTLNYGMLGFIAKPLDYFLHLIHEFVHNYGWCIILLTLLLKLLMLPFTWQATASQRKTVDLQKKLSYLQQKYQHDRARLDQERTELIKKHGMPGLASCLPMLLTLPVFWALNIILRNSLNLYEASFLWVPNLAAHDPYYIIPMLCGAAMLLNPMGGQEKDIKNTFTKYALALLTIGVTAQMSAGLALFIFVNVFLSVVQMKFQQKGAHA